MNKKIILLMLLLPLLLMISIFTSTQSIALNVKVAVSKIEISGNNIVYLDLDKQEKYFVNYVVYPVGATNKNIIFTTEQVGTQQLADLEYKNGYIIPKSMGVAKVYLTTIDGGFKDSFIVRVESNNVQSIECSISNNQIMVGDTIKIDTIFIPDNANNKILTYSSSDNSIASVSSKGVIRGEGNGQAIITIASEANPNATDTIVIEVLNQDIIDISQREVYTWETNGYVNISVDTAENYELSYQVYDVNNSLIENSVFEESLTGFVKTGEGKEQFNYVFKDNFVGSVIVKFTIITDNEIRDPFVKECIIHKVDEFLVSFDSEEALKCYVGGGIALLNEITITPEDADVTFDVQFSNDNIRLDTSSSRLKIDGILPGVSIITLTVTSNDLASQSVVLNKEIVVLPTSLDIDERGVEFGIENIWTVGQYEIDNSLNTSKVKLSTKSDIGSNFWQNVSYYTDNEYVTINSDGVIRITNNEFNGIVNIIGKFEYDGAKIETEPYAIRCIGNGVNVRCFNDLYLATNQNKIVVLQKDIIDDFGKDLNGNDIYTEDTITKINSTYDTTHYSNLGKLEDAKIKVLISFKSDVYGNGYTINAHNVAYGLDSAGQLKSNAMFQGPLNFVSMSESESSLVSVKGQDNICFAVYENVTINNIELKSCDLQTDNLGNYDLTDLTYVGTTVEVLGDNVNINYSRLTNGRTVLRIFGDINDSNKVINVNIKNSVLSSAREFIVRMGSNCFVDGTKENCSPYLDSNTSISIPAQKDYNKMSVQEKLNYEKRYIKTFVNLKNSILKDSGLFCIGIDTHFSGMALANGEGLANGLISSWKDLAKTSYGAKLTMEGDVRIYDWKNVSSIDSSTLIEVIGSTSYDLSFDIKELIDELASNEEKPYLNTIVYNKQNDDKTTTQYVHGGIAFFGGGKNYGVVDFKNYEFQQLNGYEVKLSDVGKVQLQVAAGDESFYFLLNDSTTTGFLPEDQEELLNPSPNSGIDPEEAYAPIYKKD